MSLNGGYGGYLADIGTTSSVFSHPVKLGKTIHFRIFMLEFVRAKNKE